MLFRSATSLALHSPTKPLPLEDTRTRVTKPYPSGLPVLPVTYLGGWGQGAGLTRVPGRTAPAGSSVASGSRVGEEMQRS